MTHAADFRDAIAAAGLTGSDENTVRRFMAKIRVDGECWVWTAARFKAGYGKFAMVAARDGKEVTYAHRCSYRLFIGPIPAGFCVCHRCDVPGCVNPAHLFLGTHLQNMRDCISKGRANKRSGPLLGIRGALHGNSKLTEENVVEILASAASNRDLGAKFSIDYRTVWAIRARKSWKHIKVAS